MLDMILKYQRPRITYYLNKLRKALRFEEPTTCTAQDKRPRLSDEWLQKLPVLHTRSWIDDNKNEFQFSGASLDEAENISRAALSAQSLKNINDEVDSIFKLVDPVSSLDENEDGHLSRAILKQLLPSLFSVCDLHGFKHRSRHVYVPDFKTHKIQKRGRTKQLQP
jgi:hypothetical protein